LRYFQPYGVSDPDAAYVNGNPSTGTMGSIPPAQSIEHPQREIVNLIKDSSLVPDVADLHQLGRALQTGSIYFAMDESGTDNAFVVNLVPAPRAYYKGMTIRVLVKFDVTGPTACNCNGLGPVPVMLGNLALASGLLYSGDVAELTHDGTKFQLVGGMRAYAVGAPVYLTAPKHYYVNNNGSDTYDGLSAAFSTGSHGPFKTLQKAVDQVTRWNLNGYSVTIHIADGSYITAAPTVAPIVNGSGSILIVGNSANPAAVVIGCSAGTALVLYSVGAWSIDGVTFSAPARNLGTGDPGNGLSTGGNNECTLGNINFNACFQSHVEVASGAHLGVSGNIRINGTANAIYHLHAASGGHIAFGNPSGGYPGPILTAQGTVVFSGAFITAQMLSEVAGFYYGGTIGAPNVGGYRYISNGLSVINSNGGGPNAFPGNAAGLVQNGGQYF
jgi:hypothetical protein